MKLPHLRALPMSLSTIILIVIVVSVFLYNQLYDSNTNRVRLSAELADITEQKMTIEDQLASVSAELETLKNVDQKKRNDELETEIKNIQNTYNAAVNSYEDLVKLRERTKTDKYDALFTKALTDLAKRNFATASAQFKDLDKQIAAENDKLNTTAAAAIPANVPQSNTPPGSGYSRQQVTSAAGTVMVSLVAGDLGSTRVVVDTASGGDCGNDCPVLALGDYVARNGAYAGVNGSYFCPASYPSCAGKTNSFDTLLMNKNKVYFNSENNKFSTVPAVIFGSGFVRFIGQSLEWGRDTSIDSMIANQPLLVSGGNVVFGGDGDPKKGSVGNRSFVSNKGNTVYIGVVHGATVAGAAHVLKAMGMDNALNLDSGGSTALWSGGYKVGPGRAIPNAILFVKK